MNNMLILFGIQVILFIIIMILVYKLLLGKSSINYDKRFGNYTIKIKDKTITLSEKLYKYINNLIKKVSVLLKKSKVMLDYSKNYDKYVNQNYFKIDNSIDFISIKFVISILFSILYILSSLVRNNFNIMILLLLFILIFFIFDIVLKLLYKKRKKEIESELLNAIIIMNNSFKSGMNIVEAINVVIDSLNGPIKEEFKKIKLDIKYGLELNVVFERFYNRVKIEDIKYITSSLSLINKTGGNIVKIFNSIEKNFYDKKKLNDEMNSLISSSKFMYRLLVFLPLFVVFIILMVDSSYYMVLFKNVIGTIILLITIIFYIIYIIVVKKIMKVRV